MNLEIKLLKAGNGLTASVLIAVTTFMGFIGHAVKRGIFYAGPLAIVTIIGDAVGGKFALKTRPKNLKKYLLILIGQLQYL